MAEIDERLTEQFRLWETRGRGWQIYPEPVFPEPPFRPFPGHFLPETPVIDDGRRPTFLSSLVQRMSRKLSTEKPVSGVIPEPEAEPEAEPLIRNPSVEWQASIPNDLDVPMESVERFFRNLSLCREPVAFELVGTHGQVTVQFAASTADAPTLRKQLQAHFPDVTFRAQDGALEAAWDQSRGNEAIAVEFGLEREFLFSLAADKQDPFVGIVGALAELEPGELAVYQVLWQPVEHPWGNNMVYSVTHSDGKPFFVNAPELTAAAKHKAAKLLYAVVVRILIRTENEGRLHDLARDLAGSFRAFTNPEGNALIPLRNDEYPFAEHIADVLSRQSCRSGMIISGEELRGFVHLPGTDVRATALKRDSGETKAAPEIVRRAQGIFIGDNEHAGVSVPIYLSADQRVRHTHIIGSSGAGKSSLLFSMIRQDIERGEGVAVLDPAGDLIEQLLGVIPENRIGDVVLVNPSDAEFPVAFNILQAHSEEEKNLLASDLVSVFRRLSSSWGDQMDAVLQNAILVFLESRRGGTLADLRRFLLEPAFMSEFLKTVDDPELIYYWQKVFPRLTGGRSVGPVLTRLQDFFGRKPLRNMVSQPENKLDFGQIMDNGHIFLAKLSEGLLGKENSYLLGTLLVSKFQQLAMARQAQNAASRRDFWIYIDEFYNFITPSMAQILQGARKYRIGLTLAHHELRQLQRDPEVASAVMTHPCTRIVYHVGDEDAKRLSDCFESFDAKSLKTLEKYHAIARVERNDFDFNLSFPKPEFPEKADAERRAAEVIAASRSKYATPRAVVEAALLASIRGTELTPTAKATEELTPRPSPPFPVPPVASDLPTKALAIEKPTVSETETASPPARDETKLQPLKPEASPPREPGRGGANHRAIQERLRLEAHKRGFLADSEKQLRKDSNQAADLMLRGKSATIAVEITVTTSITHEFENIQKCLGTGCTRVAVISTNRRHLDDIAAAVQGGLGSEAAAKVSYYSPDEFIAELDRLVREAPPESPLPPGEHKSRGHIVRRHIPSLTPEEAKEKDAMIGQIMRDSMLHPKEAATAKPRRNLSQNDG